jgi:hypothetical protein
MKHNMVQKISYYDKDLAKVEVQRHESKARYVCGESSTARGYEAYARTQTLSKLSLIPQNCLAYGCS